MGGKIHIKEISLKMKLGTVMGEVYNHVYDKAQEFFLRYDLTCHQYGVVLILSNSSVPLSTSDILKKMPEKNSGVSRMVDRLILKGLVEKVTNSKDKRLVDIQLTLKGKKLYEEIEKHIFEIDNIYSSVTEEEAKLLIDLLSKLKG
ncbi:MarR family transcriptional regulator [Chryseobacterium sp. Chry.R1]|uniref:MarR family winged helix-turn-helix transcriptional regulator n=1 Tax=Chryseobacterium sp. Chry.R1 TaxID=3139392 RepID=UPI0031F85BC1